MSGASVFNGGTTIVSTANADSTVLRQVFTVTDAQVKDPAVFVLTNFSYAPGTNSLEVYVNGVFQNLGTDVTETSVNSFIILGGVESGDTVTARGIIGVAGTVAAAQSATSAAASLAAIQGLALPALPLSIANGGTGVGNRQASLNALSGMAIKGSMFAFDGADVKPLVAGADGMYLVTDSTNAYGVKWSVIPNFATQVITANGALTAGGYIFTSNYTITAPDLTNVSNFSLTSSATGAALPTTFNTVDGWSVSTGFSVGVTKTLTPVFGSPHGWWGTLNMTPKLNASNNSGALGTGPMVVAHLALSATCVIAMIYDSVGAYLVSYDPTTGLLGSVITLASNGASPYVPALYATGANSFIAFYQNNGTSNQGAIAGTAGAGAVLTTGAAVSIGAGFVVEPPIQLTATSYITIAGTVGADLYGLTVNTATSAITVGASANSGCPSPTAQSYRLVPISATTALVAYPTSAAGATSVTARVATLTGTAIALGATAVSANATNRPSGTSPNNVMVPFAAGSNAVLYGAIDNLTANQSNWNAITVAGNVASIGPVNTQVTAGLLPTQQQRTTYSYQTRNTSTANNGKNVFALDATRILHATSNGTMASVVISIAGNVLTFGASQALAVSGSFLTDVATGNSIYHVTAASMTKYAIAGNVITPGTPIAASNTNVIFSDTVTDKVVNYGATWYTWAGVPAAGFAISTTKYVNISSWPTLNSYGNFS